MRREALTRPLPGRTIQLDTYTATQTMQELVDALQHLADTPDMSVALVSIRLQFAHTTATPAQIEHSLHSFLDNLRPLVRKTDQILVLDRSYHFLLRGATLQGAGIVQERLWETLVRHIHNLDEGELVRPSSITIGYSAYPFPQADAWQCLAAARVERLSLKVQPEPVITTPKEIPTTDGELAVLARQLGVPYLATLPRRLPARVKQLLNADLAHELHCYPLGCERDTLSVALLHPQDQKALARLRQETGMQIFPVLTHPQELQLALEHFSTN